jgi:cytidylate kinase
VTHHPAITISRTLGSGGAQAGFLAARLLGWHFCDRRILRLAAAATNHSVDDLEPQEEHPTGFLDQLMFILGVGSPEATYAPHLDMPIYSRELFNLEKALMLRLVEHAPSVILGRGGFIALKGRGNTLHVRIDADPAFRIQSLVAQGKAPDLDAARQAILQSDRDRAALIRKISGLDWNDPRNFDLLVDMSSCGPEICAERIASAAESRFEVCRPTGRNAGVPG